MRENEITFSQFRKVSLKKKTLHEILHDYCGPRNTNSNVTHHVGCTFVLQVLRFIDDIKKSTHVESIYSEPKAKVDKKQWHQFSKIKRKPTVLLSASILEYKRRR